MNELDPAALGEALAGRVLSLARTDARLRALDDSFESRPHVVGEPDPEAVLRRALLALSSEVGYASARRVLAGAHVEAGEELAKAGLVIWDPVADSMTATPLLTELMRVFETALSEARGQK